MSRRMGPGGRLRPAPRSHRNAIRIEPNRPASGLLTPRAPDGVLPGPSSGLLGTPAYEALTPVPRPGALNASPATAGFDVHADPVADVLDVPGRDPVASDEAPVGVHAALPHPFDRRPLTSAPGLGASHPLSGQARPTQSASERVAPACTAPQLRRFIKSRAYVPMHELRRRFAIDGGDDDVTGVDLVTGRIYVGLPAEEGHLLGDLLRGGEIGFELSMDPQTPVVVGVYAMRPVPRS
jgi:hypothetical protein